jgi:hypothetical protein
MADGANDNSLRDLHAARLDPASGPIAAPVEIDRCDGGEPGRGNYWRLMMMAWASRGSAHPPIRF